MTSQQRTRFHLLEDRVQIDMFLTATQQKHNDHARMVVQSAYSIMRLIEWPDDKWSIETTLDCRPRHFFHTGNSDLGIMLLLTIAGANLRVPFLVYDTGNHPVYRFVFGGNDIGSVDPANKASMASLANKLEDSLVELVSDGRYQRT